MIIICSASMSLTAFFILDISSISLNGLNKDSKQYIITGCILVGISIDLLKYFFWGNKDQWLKALSIMIVILSWLASLSFMMSQHDNIKQIDRKLSSEYSGYLAEIKRLETVIQRKRELSDQKKNSSYHKQWKEAEVLDDEADQLDKQLTKMIGLESTIGISGIEENGINKVFITISNTFNTTPLVARYIAFGLLALMIEFCALGAIKTFLKTFHAFKTEYEKNKISIKEKEKNKSITPKIPSKLTNAVKNKKLSVAMAKLIWDELVIHKANPGIKNLCKNLCVEEKDAAKYIKIFIETGILTKENGSFVVYSESLNKANYNDS